MQPQNFTNIHRAELIANMAEARAAREAEATFANEQAERLPKSEELEWDMKLYLKAGHWAGHACLWFAFIAPILLILQNWD